MRNQPSLTSNRTDTTCARCGGHLGAYSGEAANSSSTRHVHHAGQCADRSHREEIARKQAQRDGFAWSCRSVQLGMFGGEPEICDAGGSDRSEYQAHMQAHGKRALVAPKMARLRKTALKPAFPAVDVPIFKYLRWTERRFGEWVQGVGNPLIAETERRGQFWSEGPDPHSVWVIPFDAAPWETTPKAVILYVIGDGRVTTDWQEAKRERREINRRRAK